MDSFGSLGRVCHCFSKSDISDISEVRAKILIKICPASLFVCYLVPTLMMGLKPSCPPANITMTISSGAQLKSSRYS